MEREGIGGQRGVTLWARARDLARFSTRHVASFDPKPRSVPIDLHRARRAYLIARSVAASLRVAETRVPAAAPTRRRAARRAARIIFRVCFYGSLAKQTTVRWLWRRRAEPTARVRRVPLGSRRARTRSACRLRNRHSSLGARTATRARCASVCGAHRPATFRRRRARGGSRFRESPGPGVTQITRKLHSGFLSQSSGETRESVVVLTAYGSVKSALHTLSRTLSSAMRMNSPFAACLKYAARGSSSTSTVISSSRGSGCITTDELGSASMTFRSTV